MTNLIEDIDINLARKISLSEAKRLKILPIKEMEGIVYVATSKEEQEGEDFLNFLFSKKIKYIKVQENDLSNMMNLILDFKEDTLEEDIFKDAIKDKASDIHFEPIKDTVNIRFRINGELILIRKIKFNEYLKIASRLKIKANLDITEKRRPQDGKLFIKHNNKTYNCRVSTIPVVKGIDEKIIIESTEINKEELLKLKKEVL